MSAPFKKKKLSHIFKGPSCRDRIVVGFTTTYAISAYHHWCCEFEPHSWRGVFDATLCDKVCQWHATGRWFSPGTPVSSTNKTGHQAESTFTRLKEIHYVLIFHCWWLACIVLFTCIDPFSLLLILISIYSLVIYSFNTYVKWMLHTIFVLSFLIGQFGQMNFRREALIKNDNSQNLHTYFFDDLQSAILKWPFLIGYTTVILISNNWDNIYIL
jgi:hypothetical protein